MTGLPVLRDWKGESYDLMLFIDNQLTKRIYYEPMKITIDVSDFARLIINIVIKYYSLLDFIITNQGSLSKSKF